MLNFCDFVQVYVFSTNHHLKDKVNISFIRKYIRNSSNINLDLISETVCDPLFLSYIFGVLV